MLPRRDVPLPRSRNVRGSAERARALALLAVVALAGCVDMATRPDEPIKFRMDEPCDAPCAREWLNVTLVPNSPAERFHVVVPLPTAGAPARVAAWQANATLHGVGTLSWRDGTLLAEGSGVVAVRTFALRAGNATASLDARWSSAPDEASLVEIGGEADYPMRRFEVSYRVNAPECSRAAFFKGNATGHDPVRMAGRDDVACA